jgi:hypothetical protein
MQVPDTKADEPRRCRAKIKMRGPDRPRPEHRRPDGTYRRPRPGRDARSIEKLAERARRKLEADGVLRDEMDEEAIQAEAQAEFANRVEQARPRHPDRINPKVSEGPPDDHDLVMQAAMLRSPEGKLLRDRLMAPPVKDGRPADRGLAVAIVLFLFLRRAPINFKEGWKEFCKQSNPLLEWAYEEPYNSAAGSSYSNVMQLLQGRDSRGTLGLFQRTDFAFMHDLLASAWVRLMAPDGPWPHALDAVSLDGTDLPLRLVQEAAVSERHEAMLNRRFETGDVAFASHGEHKIWRGMNGMSASSPLGPPLAGAFYPFPGTAAGGEPSFAVSILDRLIRHVRAAGRPDWMGPKVVLADRAMFTNTFCGQCLWRYGSHPIVPWSEPYTPEGWNAHTPICCGEPMMRHKPEYWPTQEVRAELGLKPGDDYRDHMWPKGKRPRARMRYRCNHCQEERSYYPDDINEPGVKKGDGAHIITWVPHADIHRHGRPDLYKLRLDFESLQNAAETFNGQLKHGGLGLHGNQLSDALCTRNHVEAALLTRTLGLTLRRLLLIDGSYQRVLDSCPKVLLTPGLLATLQEKGLLDG